MARGRHSTKRRFGAAAIVASVAGVLVLAVGGGAFAAYRYEQAHADRILPGVTVAGVRVGGLTRSEAIHAVRVRAAARLDARIDVTAAGSTWHVTAAQLGERASIDSAVDRALAVGDRMSVWSRFWHRVREEPVNVRIPLAFRHGGTAAVERLLGRIGDAMFVPAVDASVGLDAGRLTFTRAREGRRLALDDARVALTTAIENDLRTVSLGTRPVRPDVRANTLGPTIVVRLDRNKLYLYDGFDEVKSWDVATAKPGFTTPDGVWTIWDKRVDPTWYNPALDSWGAGLPAVIPGGPGNPMGTRALYINAPGLIRIHGTSDDTSIGRYASHGCIRMHNTEIEQLYPLVPIGTHVIVMGARPATAQEWDTPATADI